MSEVKITYPDAREFSQIIDAVSALIEEASFTLASDGLKLRALDPSRTAMIDLLIPREHSRSSLKALMRRLGLALTSMISRSC